MIDCKIQFLFVFNLYIIVRILNLAYYIVSLTQASEKEREKILPTMKDNDFLGDKLKISIGEEAKEKLLETLAADVDFLTRCTSSL